jgi:hypothetical protein
LPGRFTFRFVSSADDDAGEAPSTGRKSSPTFEFLGEGYECFDHGRGVAMDNDHLDAVDPVVAIKAIDALGNVAQGIGHGEQFHGE